MKIAMFTETFTPQVNGVVTSICSFTEELEARGHEIEIFAPKPGKEEHDGTPVHRFKSVTFRPYPEFKATLPPVRINKKVKGHGFELIHTHGPFAMGWAGLVTAKRNKLPCVSTFHTPISDYVPYLFKGKNLVLLGKKLAWKYTVKHYNRYKEIVVPSEIIKKLLEDKGVKTPLHVVPTGIRLEDFEMENTEYIHEKLDVGEFILHAGRISKEKNIDTVIRAMKNIDSQLVITSKGPELEKLKKLVKKEHLEEKVVFAGYVDSEDLVALYHECAFSVIASEADTQGLVITEAMACGTPVIGANALAIPEIINGENGVLFELKNAEDLSEKANMLLEENELRKKMSLNAIKTAKENSIEKRTDEMLKVYEQAEKT